MAKFCLVFIILQKKSPAACFYYFLFLKTPNLSFPEVDFLTKSLFLSKNKTPEKIRLRRAAVPMFFSPKISPAAWIYYFPFFKIVLLLLFSQNPPNIFFCFYYFTFKGGYCQYPSRYLVNIHPVFYKNIETLECVETDVVSKVWVTCSIIG